MDTLNTALHKWAITININPMSFVSLPVGGKMVRKRWKQHDNADRQYFLLSFVNLLKRDQVGPDDIVYRFEDTEKGISHMHLSVKTTAQVITKCKLDFCALVDRKMPDSIKERCVKILEEYNSQGWQDYMRKEDTDDTHSEHDTPIKMPTRNIMIRHRIKA